MINNIEYIEIDFENQKIKVPKENIVVKLLEDISSTLKKPRQGQLSLQRFNGDISAPKNSKEYSLYNSLLGLQLFLDGTEVCAIPDTFINGLTYNNKCKIIEYILSLEIEDKNSNQLVIGAIHFYIKPLQNTAVIENLQVKNNYLGNGYGSILFQAAMLISLLYGSKSITIDALNDSYLLYVKYGFCLEKDKMLQLCLSLKEKYLNPKIKPRSTNLTKKIIQSDNKVFEDESDSESESEIVDTLDILAFINNLEMASRYTSDLSAQFEVDNAKKILMLYQKYIAQLIEVRWNFNSVQNLTPLRNQIKRFNPDFPFEQYVDLSVFNKSKRKRSGSDLIAEDVPVTKKIIVDSEEEDLSWIDDVFDNTQLEPASEHEDVPVTKKIIVDSEEEDLSWIDDVFDNTQLEPVSEHAFLGKENMLYTANVEQTFFSETRLPLCTSSDLNIPFSSEKNSFC